jgi:hypothetical protein
LNDYTKRWVYDKVHFEPPRKPRVLKAARLCAGRIVRMTPTMKVLLPALRPDEWATYSTSETSEFFRATLVPRNSDYTAPTTMIETQTSAFPGGTFDVDEFAQSVATAMVGAGFSQDVQVEATLLEADDIILSFHYVRDPIVSPLTDIYRIKFAEDAMFVLTISSQSMASSEGTSLDAMTLARSAVVCGSHDLTPFAAIDMRDSTHRGDIERVAEFVRKLSAHDNIDRSDTETRISDPYSLPPLQFSALSVSLAQRQGLESLREYLQLLKHASEPTQLTSDATAWLAARCMVARKGLEWMQQDTLADRAEARIIVLESFRKVCQHGIDGAYLIRKQVPDDEAIATLMLDLGEFRAKTDLCLAVLRGVDDDQTALRPIEALAAASRSEEQRTRFEVLGAVVQFLKGANDRASIADPSELWHAVAKSQRSVTLLRALNDLGALLLATGRLANDVAWQTACFTVDAASIIDFPAEFVRSNDAAEHELSRSNKLQQLASCHAAGITLDQLDYLYQHTHRSSEQKATVGFALFLRNLRSARRYVLRNRFREMAQVESWPIEPPRMTLEAALVRTLPVGLLMTAVGGGYDALGMGRMVLLGGQWKDMIVHDFEYANFLVVIPSQSEGLLWEAEQLVARGLLENTIWIMPPADATPSGEWEWSCSREPLESLGIRLPKFRNEGGFVFLDHSGKLKYEVSFDELWCGRLSGLVRRYAWRDVAQ